MKKAILEGTGAREVETMQRFVSDFADLTPKLSYDAVKNEIATAGGRCQTAQATWRSPCRTPTRSISSTWARITSNWREEIRGDLPSQRASTIRRVR